MVLHLHANEVSIRRIARTINMSRQTIGRYVHGEHVEVRAKRKSIIDPYMAYLESRLQQRCHNAAQLWCKLKGQGFQGSDRQVTRWARTSRASAPTDSCRYTTLGVYSRTKSIFPA